MIRWTGTSCILLALIYSPFAWSGATLDPVYLDGSSEGFNDPGAPHELSSDDGNPGDTLGKQRRWAFEKALEFWELRLDSNIRIFVESAMNDLDCDSSSAVLGFAGANTAHANWNPAPGGESGRTDTWYGQALANKLANKDNDPDSNDIGSQFNKTIDESDQCLGSIVWYYALGDAPDGTVSFYKVAVHEIGHGINFQTFVTLSDGTKLKGMDDIYMVFLEDHSLGEVWPNMTDSEREESAIDTDDLHWVGAEVRAGSDIVAADKTGDHVHMYAPDPLEDGSSVSHWDTDVETSDGDDELMEPTATGAEKVLVTDELLHDLGWNDVPANNCTFAEDRLTFTGTLTGTNSHEACVSVTYDGAVIESDDTSALAKQQIIMKNGFTVQGGATFAANTDPAIGL
jgi:hypothetical protein